MPAPASEEVMYCQRHPDVETALRCGRCEALICPRCLVFTPAGARCPDCARLRRPPMYELGAREYALTLAVGVGIAFVLGVGGALLLPVGMRGGFFFLTLAVFGGTVLGGGVAEAFQRATRYKRGPVMQGAAVATLVVADLIRLVLSGGVQLIAADLAVTLLLVIAGVVAWGRLR